MKRSRFTFLFVLLITPVFAQSKSVLNLDKTGVAIQGYDPVAFFNDGKPVKGKPELAFRHNGAAYYFASREHRVGAANRSRGVATTSIGPVWREWRRYAVVAATYPTAD